MAQRRFLPIQDLPFVGGAVCLDFINTTGARESAAPRERLASYQDMLLFCRRTKLLDKAQTDALRQESEKRPPAGRSALARAIAVREALYRIFCALATRAAVAEADLALFNKELAEARRHRQLGWTRGRPRWVWTAGPAELGQMLSRILYSAAELLEAPDLAALKQCAECDWLFVDSTKNHSRRWCKATCGDRVKSRRYYQRCKDAGNR